MTAQSIISFAHSIYDHCQNVENRAYGAFLGVQVGIVTGIAYRMLHGIPAEFKQLPPFVPSPFQYKILNDVNRVMQAFIKGPYKYALAFLPLSTIGYQVISKAWQNRELSIWNSLKEEVRLVPKAKIVRAVTTVAIAMLVCATQSYWLPVVATVVPYASAKPSGHIIMQTSLTLAHAWTIQSLDQAGHKRTAKLFTAVSAAYGIANAIFIFNTLTVPFHNLYEIRDGILLSSIIVWISTP